MKKTLLFLLLALSVNCFAQFSKTHYIPPLSGSDSVIAEDQYMYISTPSLTPVAFKIYNLGGTTVNGTVSRDVPYVHTIGFGNSSQLMVQAGLAHSVLSNKGFIVEAEDLIYVTVRTIAGNGNQAGEIVSKGLAALGTEFRIGGFLNLAIADYSPVQYTFISVLATENNTAVHFSGIKAGAQLLNDETSGNNPVDIILNSGESYVIAVQGPHAMNRDALIGSLVTSNKPIALNCGSFGGSNGEMSNLDLGFDQIVSAERTGKEYIFIKSTGQIPVERVLLIGHEDNTDIFINGNPVPQFTINAGEYVTLDGSDYNALGNMYVQTSKNIFAYQSIGDDGRTDQANQEMFFVPPLSCETPKVIDNIPFLNRIGTRVFNGRVTMVTETGSTLNFVIDTVPLTLAQLATIGVTVAGPSAVTGNPNFVAYTITGLNGNVSVYSTSQLYLASYGSSDAATFGGYYSGFTFKPEVSFDQVDVTLDNCIPNVALSVNSVTGFDTFQWYFNDVLIPGANGSSYSPTLPGYYFVKAAIASCGSELTSDNIPVSSCAPNTDGDLANDNADIDSDNDGITNCSESYGNQPFNLANPLAGTITAGTYANSFTGSFPTPVGPVSGSAFVGNANGSFTTQVSAGKGNSVVYQMNFAQPVSYVMDYIPSGLPGSFLDSNAEFKLNSPVNETITVLNPTNQLLIDTNYDGIYESGIVQFSSFEIRFRLNSALPLMAGTGTFRFQANLASSVRFTHLNLSDDLNRASFQIAASCVPKDSDGDGVYNYLDADSDNDGIPDIYESQGDAFTPLSGIDFNNDGMDNAFGAGIVPADSDSDGTANYLDLDSDNNGVFDLVESGSNAPDANNNGVIDGNPAAFGPNGLANSIETATNSGVINYTLSDSDGDGISDYVESDNDNDLCNDVREAGFADGENDDYLGNTAPVVNANGVVTGAGGYTAPNPNYTIAAPIIITAQPQNSLTCEAQDSVFTVATNAGITYQWQVSINGTTYTNLTDNTIYTGTATASLIVKNVTPGMNGYKYRVLLGRSGNICGLLSAEATLSINALPPIITRTLVQCDTGTSPDGITLFLLTEADSMMTNNDPNLALAYFANLTDAENNQNQLGTTYTNLSNPQSIVVRITDNTTGCFSYSTLILSANLVGNQIINMPEQCDTDGIEDGFHVFDLTDAFSISGTQNVRFYLNENDALLEQNQIPNPAQYVNLVPYAVQTIYARVENNTNRCNAITEINIKVNPLPDIDTNPDLEPHVVCVNSLAFTTTIDAAILDGSPPAGYSYQWYFEGNLIPGANQYSLTLSTEGTYSVLVTDANGCSKTRTVPVIASSSAIIENITVVDFVENNTITVTITSNSYGDYMYSLDYPNAGQTSNVFTNVAPGVHTVFIRDKNGCPITSQEVPVAGIPKFFTPNGDGYNDTWNVKGVTIRYNYNTLIYIYDRYGKLLKQLGAAGEGWDGTFNGQMLPSDDYWYDVYLEDGRKAKGHFALKR